VEWATNVYDISSTGQLIPFITGALSLVALLQVGITDYLRENQVPSKLKVMVSYLNFTKRILSVASIPL
jgi:hypothetical protein